MGAQRCLGLVVARVVGLQAIEFAGEACHPGLAVPQAEYLGPVARCEQGDVQLIEIERLLTAEHHEVLFSRAGEQM